MLRFSLPCPRQNLAHRQSLSLKPLFVLQGTRGIHRHQVSLVAVLAGIAMTGEEKQQAVVLVVPVLINEVREMIL